jgi:heterodisulfide reductase subunit C
MTTLQPGLVDEVRQDASFNASACMNCGVCTAICPMGLDHLPREIFRYVLLGMKDEVLAHQETVFSCLLCKLCEVNCPAGVHITENVRALRHYFDQNVFRV